MNDRYAAKAAVGIKGGNVCFNEGPTSLRLSTLRPLRLPLRELARPTQVPVRAFLLL